MVLIVDGDNVRGKSRFRVKEELLYACSEMAKRSPFLSVLIVFLIMALRRKRLCSQLKMSRSDYGGESVLTRGIRVHFAGPEKSADDVARDVPYFQNLILEGVLEEETVIGVVTHDMKLRKRCRPKSVRLSKKRDKKKVEGEASRFVANGQGSQPEVKIVSSTLLVEYAEEILANADAQDVATYHTRVTKNDSSTLFTSAQIELLMQEQTLRAKLKERESLLSSCVNRKVKPRLEAEVTSLQKRVAVLNKEGHLLQKGLQTMSLSQMQSGLAMVRVNEFIEESWERELLAERLRLVLP